MSSINLAGHSFILSDPYVEGHRLTLIEAQVLNALRTENIYNILYKRLSRSRTRPDLASVSALVAEQEAKYTFRPPPAKEPTIFELTLERVAMEMAQDRLRKEESDPAVQALTKQFTKLEAVQDEVRRRLEIQTTISRRALETLTEGAARQPSSSSPPEGI